MSSNVGLVRGPAATGPVPIAASPFPTICVRGLFRAADHQRLPPLVTTSLHGALERALATVDLRGVFRRAEASALTRPLGVTDAAPPAYVLCPGLRSGFRPEAPLELESGQLLELEVTLLGPRAIESAPTMVSALARVAELGLARVGPNGRRPRLELVEADVVSPPTRAPRDRMILGFRTPVRLTFGGKVSSRVDAEVLTAALWRRAELLARVHGDGTASSQMPAAGSLVVRSANLDRVEVLRYSHRQGRRMRWPGLMGTIEIAGARAWWPVLELCQRAQFGKATSFGFGKFDLIPLGPSTEEGER